jgi:hypothetical protein
MRRLELILWVCAVIWAGLLLVPASYWFNPHTLHIPDAIAGEDFELLFTGDVERDFTGYYSVVIRNVEDFSTPTGGEMRSGARPYTPDAVQGRPDPITMSWWAHEVDVENLEPGYYVLNTCWTIIRPFLGLTPNKTVCIESNVFHLGEASSDER